MDGAVATLRMAARELQLASSADKPTYTRIVAQLRRVAEQLSAAERRASQEAAEPVDFAAIWRDALPTPALVTGAGQPVTLTCPIMSWSKARRADLRALVRGMVEYAFTIGCDAIELRVDDRAPARQTCVTELVVRAREFPDFLQQNLWKVVRSRGGEVSTVSEPEKSRIRFTLPIERRAGRRSLLARISGGEIRGSCRQAEVAFLPSMQLFSLSLPRFSFRRLSRGNGVLINSFRLLLPEDTGSRGPQPYDRSAIPSRPIARRRRHSGQQNHTAPFLPAARL